MPNASITAQLGPANSISFMPEVPITVEADLRARLVAMIQELLPLLPHPLLPNQFALCVLALTLGVALFFVGGLWSRGIVTLVAVAVGGIAGLNLPRWYLWPVNPMSMAVLGAVVCGVMAFAIPRLWVGLTLGTVLCAWALFGTWVCMRGDGGFEPRAPWQTETMIWPDFVKDCFFRLPEHVRRVVPYSVASAMVSGLAVTLLWPRFGRTFMGSTLAVTLVTVAGLTLMNDRQPQWLMYLPSEWQAQVMLLVGFVLLGALVQWQILPGKHEIKPFEEQEPQQSLQPLGR